MANRSSFQREEKCFHRETHSDSTELEVKTATHHFGLLMPLKAEKGVAVLAQVIDPNDQGENGGVLLNGAKEEYVWNTGNPLGCPLQHHAL